MLETKVKKGPRKKESDVPKKVKKEKKPITVVAIVTPHGIEGSFSEPKKPLIVHLPFSSKDVQFTETASLRYDPHPPNQPVPYEDESSNVYFNIFGDTNSESTTKDVSKGLEEPVPEQQQQQQQHGQSQHGQSQSQKADTKEKSNTLLKEDTYERTVILGCYMSSPGKPFTIPKNTQVHCYWCAHSFQNEPCFLPVKEENQLYYIYGNFCTPQCGLAYLLNEHLDSHVRWERMALLHRMYRPNSASGGRLYPAPPRESLIEFGGIYTYDEFRNHIACGSIRVDIHKPPMLSILGVLDTKPIDFYDSSLQNTLTQGFSMDRFKAWSEQGGALRLKRSKPLKDMESTLDACIQIKIKRG